MFTDPTTKALNRRSKALSSFRAAVEDLNLAEAELEEQRELLRQQIHALKDDYADVSSEVQYTARVREKMEELLA